jgi:Flp pilus assembly protein TadG
MHTDRPSTPMTATTPKATSRRPETRRKRLGRGQVLVIFAGAMVMLMGVTALVVDVSWYWVNSLRIQRAADAAALAGAVQLPNDPSAASSLAVNEAKRNGYVPGNGTTISAVVDGSSTRRLDVTIQAQVGTFFMRIFGINSIKAVRTSKAEFTLPVPMGSPQNYYGVGVLNLPTHILVLTDEDTDWQDSTPAGTTTWTNPSRADANQNGQEADSTTVANTAQQWGTFGLLSGSVTIPNDPSLVLRGLELRLRDRLQGNTSTNDCRIKAEASWDGGTTWTTTLTQTPTMSNFGQHTDTLGSATSFAAWGPHIWTRADFADTMFRIRLTFLKASCGANEHALLDTLEVRVSYRVNEPGLGPPAPQDIFDPYGTTVLPPQNFWGGMQSQGAPSVQGDAYMTGYQTRKSATNPKYDPVTYYNYGIDMPSGGGEVWLFDPGFCDTAQASNNVNQGTGEDWAVGGSAGASSRHPVSAQFELFADDANTPYDITDDTLKATSGTTFKDSKYYDPDLGGTNPGGGTDCNSTSWHNNWWKLASGLPAGRYRLHSSTRIFTDTLKGSIKTPITIDGEDQTDATALNAFAIWTRDSVGTPHVYGLGAMEAYFPLSANFTSTFYLAQVEAAHAGKWMDIDLWDPGDTGALPATLSILEPTTGGYVATKFYWNSTPTQGVTTIPTNFTCGPTTSGLVPSIVTNTGGNSLFQGHWLRICVHLDDGYDAPTPPGVPDPGWWKIQYSMGGHTGDDPATDLTTWQVSIRGNPVHLVIP